MMLRRRQFVNMVVEKCKTGVCSLHRLNVSEHLFYPSTAEAEAAKPAEISRLGALPAPTFSFQSTPGLRRTDQLFALVSPRSSESRILWSSPEENTCIYDFQSLSTYALPSLRCKGVCPITISVPPGRPNAPEDDLYVMNYVTAKPYSGFEVLRFGRPTSPNLEEMIFPNHPDIWHWESLPPPPLPEGSIIRSHAVLHDGRTICVTAAPLDTAGTAGTYLFDTVERQWSRAPDGLVLPFLDGAEYIPELKIWLGVASGGSNRLCASDNLNAADSEPPTLKHEWDVVETPENWKAMKASIINLGEGRLCIFKVIHDVPPIQDEFDDFSYRGPNLGKMLALLTGVEMDYSSSPEQPRMVPHKSLSYIFKQDKINLVL